MAKRDRFTRDWIIENSIEITKRYSYGELTIRALHYQLVAIGMTNTIQHYKRVVAAMIKARWDGEIAFEVFSDHDREVLGRTEYAETTVEEKIDDSKFYIKYYMNNYKKNRWENQEVYPEVWIEKKALQGIFKPVCEEMNVSLSPCKGYPSLTFLNESADRFRDADANGKTCIILYFGDYDPSGEDIPRSIGENLNKLGAYVRIERISLLEHQVIELNLPPAPAKSTDSRTANWDGLGQVELDAVNPDTLREMCLNSINNHFDQSLYEDLLEQQKEESIPYKEQLKEYVKTL